MVPEKGLFLSTYVLSDVHGHLRALDEALSLASPSDDDAVVVLGDLVDRGPDPRGVIRLVRSLPNVTVLRGNHEELFLNCVDDPRDEYAWTHWVINGGEATARQLIDMPTEAYEDVVRWVRDLPLYDIRTVGETPYVLVHAGIVPVEGEPPEGVWTERALEEMMERQPSDLLTWIREDFWGMPTGLLDEQGRGPVVVAGHTPVSYLPYVCGVDAADCVTKEGKGRIVRFADKIDVDCAAAGGCPVGQVGILRLDDGAEFYAPVREGE